MTNNQNGKKYPQIKNKKPKILQKNSVPVKMGQDPDKFFGEQSENESVNNTSDKQ